MLTWAVCWLHYKDRDYTGALIPLAMMFDVIIVGIVCNVFNN